MTQDAYVSVTSEDTPSPAVGRAIRILEYLAHTQPEASLVEIANALELNKSTCFNILKSLIQSGIVVRDARFPIYRLGPKLVELGTASRRNYSYRALVQRALAPLVNQYEIACLLAQLLPHDAGIVVTDRVMPSRKDVLTAPIGHVYPLSVPAMGRIVLASRPFAEIVNLKDLRTLVRSGGLEQLKGQLDHFRALGYATSVEEYQRGVNAVATPVRGSDGDIALLLCLLGHATNFPKEQLDEAGAELRRTAAQLEEALQRGSPAYALEVSRGSDPWG